MTLKVLLETGFLLALNPRDKNHEWALEILEGARAGNLILYISPIAYIELSLVMKAKGYADQDILKVLNAIRSIIGRYIKYRQGYTLSIGSSEAAYATQLRTKYRELSFFDSFHASTAILNNLKYYDLDPVVKKIVDREAGRTG